ncbi:MAG: four helix bundle protein [candidate division WOR-3 bacterium]|nr:MAG: four helix bundle protein [candidate division WOR-3 bacterium]
MDRAVSITHNRVNPAKFRFQDLEIWKIAVEIANMLFDIADSLDERRLFRFSEQLRGAGISMPNNIAEGSGSNSKRDFIHFLNMARRSTFENANMIIIYAIRGLIREEIRDEILSKLDVLCRKITMFQRTLR